MISHITIETEVKWKLRNALESRRVINKLKKMGAKRLKIDKEINKMFDTPGSELLSNNKALRLRLSEGHPPKLTFKGQPSYVNGIKQRQEIETELIDWIIPQKILQELGFYPNIEYPKTRQIWAFLDALVELDHLPFGYFCEIEGSSNTIQSVAKKLGFLISNAEKKDYPTMMREYVQTQSIKPPGKKQPRLKF